MGEVTSVLVYSMGEVIGDGLIKLPFIASLAEAFPQARLTWCAAKGQTVYASSLKPIVDGLIHEVVDSGVTGIRVSDLLLLRRPFAGRRFDLVIDTQTNVRRSLVARRAARLFISPALGFRLSHRKPHGEFPEALVDRLQTLASLACDRAVPARPIALTNPRAKLAAAAVLPLGPPYVGFAPGAGGLSKRWPLDRFIALARMQRDAGRTPVFLLGPNEGDMLEPIRAALPSALFPEFERADPYSDVHGPLLVVALASRLLAAVANDAGPGHMLAAGGAPLLSLQGDRRKAVKFHPAAPRLAMLIAEDFGPGDGVANIPIDAAAHALENLVSEGA